MRFTTRRLTAQDRNRQSRAITEWYDFAQARNSFTSPSTPAQLPDRDAPSQGLEETREMYAEIEDSKDSLEVEINQAYFLGDDEKVDELRDKTYWREQSA